MIAPLALAGRLAGRLVSRDWGSTAGPTADRHSVPVSSCRRGRRGLSGVRCWFVNDPRVRACSVIERSDPLKSRFGIVVHDLGAARAPTVPDPDADMRLGFDVARIVGVVAVLGDNPEDVAVESVCEGRNTRGAALATGCLEQRGTVTSESDSDRGPRRSDRSVSSSGLLRSLQRRGDRQHGVAWCAVHAAEALHQAVDREDQQPIGPVLAVHQLLDSVQLTLW